MLLEQDLLSAKLYARLSAMSKSMSPFSLSPENSALSPDGRVAPNNVDLGIEKFNSARNARFPLGLQRLDHRTQSRSSELVFYQTMGAA